MGDQLFLERFNWFDSEARRLPYPNASKLAECFDIAIKYLQRSINNFHNRLLAHLKYESSHKGYYFRAPISTLNYLYLTRKIGGHAVLPETNQRVPDRGARRGCG